MSIQSLRIKCSQNFGSDVYYVDGLKNNLMRIGKLLQKGYKVYMEENHCMIMDIHPSKQLISEYKAITNHLFHLRIMPYIRGNKNQVVHVKDIMEIQEMLLRRKQRSKQELGH